jgi:hypothetical protein
MMSRYNTSLSSFFVDRALMMADVPHQSPIRNE